MVQCLGLTEGETPTGNWEGSGHGRSHSILEVDHITHCVHLFLQQRSRNVYDVE